MGGKGSSRRDTTLRRLRSWLLDAAAWAVCRLPEPVVAAIALGAGEIWYRATPVRAEQARRNLARVVNNLAETGRGDARVKAAASDPAKLERLVRSAYRHAVRYYLDMIRVGVGARLLPTRLVIETPDAVDRALATDGSVVLVGIHFGAVEIPALYLAERSRRPIVAPMETLHDPVLQEWLVRTRGGSGVRLVDLDDARREMAAAVERGEIVGLLGDRDLTGRGTAVSLFGTPARLPVGPALFAVDAGLPVYVGAVARDRDGRWLGRLIHVETAVAGSRRDRATAMLQAIASAFEDLIARAPDQWWTLFFPIWDDLVAGGAGRRGSSRRARTAERGSPEPGGSRAAGSENGEADRSAGSEAGAADRRTLPEAVSAGHGSAAQADPGASS